MPISDISAVLRVKPVVRLRIIYCVTLIFGPWDAQGLCEGKVLVSMCILFALKLVSIARHIVGYVLNCSIGAGGDIETRVYETLP